MSRDSQVTNSWKDKIKDKIVGFHTLHDSHATQFRYLFNCDLGVDLVAVRGFASQ